MMLLTILGLIGPLLAVLLPKVGVSSSIDGLITAAIAAISQIVSGIQTGTSVDGALLAMETALAALKADTSLDPVVLESIAEGARDLEAAITAYKLAQVNCDPSTLTPLPDLPE